MGKVKIGHSHTPTDVHLVKKTVVEKFELYLKKLPPEPVQNSNWVFNEKPKRGRGRGG